MLLDLILFVLLTKRVRGDEMKVGRKILRRKERLFEGDELVGRILLWQPLGCKKVESRFGMCARE